MWKCGPTTNRTLGVSDSQYARALSHAKTIWAEGYETCGVYNFSIFSAPPTLPENQSTGFCTDPIAGFIAQLYQRVHCVGTNVAYLPVGIKLMSYGAISDQAHQNQARALKR